MHSGGDIRSYNIARELARQHDLTFFSYYDGKRDCGYENALREQFPGSVCVCTGRSRERPLSRGLDYVARIPRRAPYAVSRFACGAVASQLNHWYDHDAFDVAVCDFLDAAVNFPKRLTIPTVLFQHNVESEIWRRHASNGSGPIKKAVYSFEFSKMLRYEQEMVRKFRHVIAVSEHDKKLMSAWVRPSRLSVVPTGVDTNQFHPGPKAAMEKPLVLFIGAMDWEPNVDAVEYFCREIWPGVQARVPEARFRIVGRNPGERVRRLAGNSVEVTGRVPSVIAHLHEATVVVVPLRIGGGTRLKIYEAMAAGKAVVSTSVGAEGLDVHHGLDIVLSDDPADFAQSVVTIALDATVREQLEGAAAELATNYGWPRIGATFGQILLTVAADLFTTVPDRTEAAADLNTSA
ncbi:MAG: glycosyltransferase [Candidatus Sulfotelmatobacter sp.]